jgi:hypothetical protein
MRPGGFKDAMRRSLEFIRGICRPKAGWALGWTGHVALVSNDLHQACPGGLRAGRDFTATSPGPPEGVFTS